MKLPRFNPYRCMRGAITNPTPVNYGTVTLYNNSTGPELLIVYFMNQRDEDIAVGCTAIPSPSIGAPAGTISPLITGEASYSGILTTLDDPNQIAADSYFNNFGTLPGSFPYAYPMAILQPGWSWVVQAETKANQIGAISFLWQSCHIEDLRSIPCSICEPWLVPVMEPAVAAVEPASTEE